MTKLYRILGKRGRITIPYEMRKRVGFTYNDVLSFTEAADGKTVIVIPESQTADILWNDVTHKTFENTLKKFRADVFKIDSDIGGDTAPATQSLKSDSIVDELGKPYGEHSGDATLGGAVYGLYQNGTLIDTYITDRNGYFVTDYYPCSVNGRQATYYIQEISASEGYLLDPEKYYGAPTWYEWCIQNWGTKWNAYGYEPDTDYSSSDALTFQTAWAGPHPILQRLSAMFPNIAFRHRWADEDIGANCGERCYFGGKLIDEYIPEGIRAADFALKVWDYDPLELGMAKNSTGTDYINIENENYQLIEIFGKPALFSNDRITPKDIPQGLYCYDLRHSDDGDRFCSVETKVTANHGGSIITDEPLELGENGYIPLDEDTEPNFLGEDLTLAEYMTGEFEQGQTMGGM